MFHNKTVFITGASMGLGRALAIKLSDTGAKLVLMARSLDKLEQTKALCNPASAIEIVCGDVAHEYDCQSAIQHTIDSFGNLDYLILNAGVSMWSSFESLHDVSVMKKLIETNYLGAVYCVHYALPFLKKSHGMIVGISSIQGKVPIPYHSGYSASKHALQSFLDIIRMELRHEINVLTVSPGWIDGTHIRDNSYGSHHTLNDKNLQRRKKSSIQLDACVNRIVKAMQKQKHELLLPGKYRILSWLHLMSPKFYSALLMRLL